MVITVYTATIAVSELAHEPLCSALQKSGENKLRGNLDTATDQALSLTGIPDADLIQYRQPLNLANLFQLFGKSEAKEIKIDLGVDLPKLKAGRLYFLSPLLLY